MQISAGFCSGIKDNLRTLGCWVIGVGCQIGRGGGRGGLGGGEKLPPQSVSRLEDVLDMKSRIRMRESTNVRERNTNPAAFICHPGRGFDVNSSQRDDSGPRPANRRAVGQSRSKGRRRAALVRAEQKKK